MSRATAMERIQRLREQLEEATAKEQEKSAAHRDKLVATVDTIKKSMADDQIKRAEAHRKVDEAADAKEAKKQKRLDVAFAALAELDNPEQYSSMQLEVVEDAADDTD